MRYQLTTRVITNSITDIKLSANFWTIKDAVSTLLFAHATGFHKETWNPTISCLMDSPIKCNFVTFDARNHGSSALENASLLSDNCDWKVFSQDILALTEQIKTRKPLIGIGHSMGGCTTLLAEELKPNTFDGIVAFEPILHATQGSRLGLDLVESTKRRKNMWKSRQAVHKYLRSKKFFCTWHEKVLEEYSNNGTYINNEGRIELKCPPAQEAATFAGAPRISEYCYERLGEVQIPVMFVGGNGSTTIAPDKITAFARQCARGISHVIPGQHLIPQEQPENTARIIGEFVATLFEHRSLKTKCLISQAYTSM